MSEGIPTLYAGVRFRSRLEATWACMFDLLGWPWDYEPFDLDGWIPDFILKGAKPVLIEVKPIVGPEEREPHGEKILSASPPYPVVMVGCGPMVTDSMWPDFPSLGVVITDGPASKESIGWFCGDGDMMIANACECGERRPKNKWGMCSGWGTAMGAWDCGLCGAYSKPAGWTRPYIPEMWAEAKNIVQWQPKRVRR